MTNLLPYPPRPVYIYQKYGTLMNEFLFVLKARNSRDLETDIMDIKKDIILIINIL
jgi:hypothetical protein